MKNHGNNKAAMSYPAMVESGQQDRRRNKIYREQSAEYVNEQLSALIYKTALELKDAATSEPVSLRDTNEVKRRTMLYLRACEEAACFPSIVGLARSMGLSRQAIYDVIYRKSPSDTAAWLELCRDSFSDILSEASLKGQCAAIPAIFIQKAVYGLRESVEIVAKQETALGDSMDVSELQRRIENSVVIDDFDESEDF